ncbi:hypothetical protein BHE90_004923 [Fusarium euwallaceae]|uniref:Integral membrane protein n=3 Tax=Fusarium solani species complex TaxID=232080 RepID=A0A3M2S7N1_9HYPO|nr:hypothetical protein CDV36_007224 [Fusarium kuroshium]RSL98624.1 hypothetical protein CDV31_012526 [Fusarium ambrosium]RTE80591.1 hypothetical protein BHE90_004923 [Fusarium euwallaceae]
MAHDRDDLSVLVHATTWAQLFVSTIFMGLRGYSRLRKVGVGLQADDWILLAGWAFLLLASGCLSWLMVIFLIPGSLTKITVARVHHNLQSLALGLTKTSFGITLLRLMPGGWEAKLIWGVIISMNLQFVVHIIATWQAICGAPDQGHIGGDKCWKLSQSVTFTVFSAALALSMGILAGITGVMKAVQGYMLIDVRSPDYLNTQAVYWIWSMAEPNVTIVSASIPVLRGFIRNVRTRTDSTPRAGTYLKTGDNSTGRFYNRTITAGRAHPEDQDGASDSSILGRSPQDGDGSSGGGITWTTEVSVEYEPRPQTENAGKDARGNVEVIEMGNIRR